MKDIPLRTTKVAPLQKMTDASLQKMMDASLQKYLYFVLSKRRKLFLKRKRFFGRFKGFVRKKYVGHMGKRRDFYKLAYGKFILMVFNYDPERSRRRGFWNNWRNKRRDLLHWGAFFRKDQKFRISNKFKIKSMFYSFYHLFFAKKLLYKGFISFRF